MDTQTLLTEILAIIGRTESLDENFTEADAWACEGALADIEHLCRRELAKTKTTSDVSL